MLKPPFEIYRDKTDIGDANGHVCTAENPEIAEAVLAALVKAYPMPAEPRRRSLNPPTD